MGQSCDLEWGDTAGQKVTRHYMTFELWTFVPENFPLLWGGGGVFFQNFSWDVALAYNSLQPLTLQLRPKEVIYYSPVCLLQTSRHVPYLMDLRWPNTVSVRFTDSVSDAVKRALGLW